MKKTVFTLVMLSGVLAQAIPKVAPEMPWRVKAAVCTWYEARLEAGKVEIEFFERLCGSGAVEEPESDETSN